MRIKRLRAMWVEMKNRDCTCALELLAAACQMLSTIGQKPGKKLQLKYPIYQTFLLAANSSMSTSIPTSPISNNFLPKISFANRNRHRRSGTSFNHILMPFTIFTPNWCPYFQLEISLNAHVSMLPTMFRIMLLWQRISSTKEHNNPIGFYPNLYFFQELHKQGFLLELNNRPRIRGLNTKSFGLKDVSYQQRELYFLKNALNFIQCIRQVDSINSAYKIYQSNSLHLMWQIVTCFLM